MQDMEGWQGKEPNDKTERTEAYPNQPGEPDPLAKTAKNTPDNRSHQDLTRLLTSRAVRITPYKDARGGSQVRFHHGI